MIPDYKNLADTQRRDDDEQMRAIQDMTPITLPEALTMLAIAFGTTLIWVAVGYGLWAWVTG